MSVDEKLDHTMILGMIEDELEERKHRADRRQKNCEETMKQKTDEDRRSNKDRRAATA